MKNTVTIIAALAIIGIGIGVYYIASNNNLNTNVPAPATQLPTTQTPAAPVPDTSVVPSSSSVAVDIKSFSFNPPTLTVKTGTKVTWINKDSVPHTITSDSGTLLNSEAISPGQSFSFTFTNTGSVKYHCKIHPTMKGQIIVN
jgi:plastocyanin